MVCWLCQGRQLIKSLNPLRGTLDRSGRNKFHGIQVEDGSQEPSPQDATAYRNVIGLLMYLSCDRMDVIFALKELTSKMAKPTLTAVQKLRKLIGFLKMTGEVGVKILVPLPGDGRWKQCDEKRWILESFTQILLPGRKQNRQEINFMLLAFSQRGLCAWFSSSSEGCCVELM